MFGARKLGIFDFVDSKESFNGEFVDKAKTRLGFLQRGHGLVPDQV